LSLDNKFLIIGRLDLIFLIYKKNLYGFWIYVVGGLWCPLRPRVVAFKRSRFYEKHSTSLKNHSKVSISCSLNESMAKVIYSVAPAMGHNKVINLCKWFIYHDKVSSSSYMLNIILFCTFKNNKLNSFSVDMGFFCFV